MARRNFKNYIEFKKGLIGQNIMVGAQIEGANIPFKKSLNQFMTNLREAYKPFLEERIELEKKFFLQSENEKFILEVESDEKVEEGEEVKIVQVEETQEDMAGRMPDYANRVLLKNKTIEDWNKAFEKLINKEVKVKRPVKRVDLTSMIHNVAIGANMTIEDYLDQSTGITPIVVSFVETYLVKDGQGNNV